MIGITGLVASALCGVGIGVLSGLLGIGGGTVMVPVFRLLFGMSPTVSTATSLFAIIPTSVSGAAQHFRNKTCLPAVGIAAGIGGAFTSPVGVWLAQRSPGWLIMLAAALIIGYSAFNMIRKAVSMGRAPKGAAAAAPATATTPVSAPAPVAAPMPEPSHLSRPSESTDQRSFRKLAAAAVIGLAAGLASGYVGVGGGFIMVPLFLSVIGMPMKQASGTSLIAVMILAIPGVIEQMLLGNVNYVAGIAIVCGTIPGAVIGARLVKVAPERALRFIFGGFLLFAALMLAVNEFGFIG